MRTITAIAVGIVLAPISALISAWAMSTLWEWFVFRDYGQGPSMAGWYGLSGIFGLAIAPSLINLKTEKGDSESPILRVINRAIGIWVGLVLVVGLAWVVGFMLHWV